MTTSEAQSALLAGPVFLAFSDNVRAVRACPGYDVTRWEESFPLVNVGSGPDDLMFWATRRRLYASERDAWAAVVAESTQAHEDAVMFGNADDAATWKARSDNARTRLAALSEVARAD